MAVMNRIAFALIATAVVVQAAPTPAKSLLVLSKGELTLSIVLSDP